MSCCFFVILAVGLISKRKIRLSFWQVDRFYFDSMQFNSFQFNKTLKDLLHIIVIVVISMSWNIFERNVQFIFFFNLSLIVIFRSFIFISSNILFCPRRKKKTPKKPPKTFLADDKHFVEKYCGMCAKGKRDNKVQWINDIK